MELRLPLLLLPLAARLAKSESRVERKGREREREKQESRRQQSLADTLLSLVSAAIVRALALSLTRTHARLLDARSSRGNKLSSR